MTQRIIIRYSEIALKGGNRGWFEKTLLRNIKKQLSSYAGVKTHKIHGRMIVEFEKEEDLPFITKQLRFIPGLANFSQASSCSHDLEEIKKAVLAEVALYLSRRKSSSLSFKVKTTRADKGFALKSMELSALMGHEILQKYPAWKVSLHDPELTVGLELWPNDTTIVYLDKHQGQGGLPVGVSGKVLVFLSGGIDSPVAGWFMLKRGCEAVWLNFHSYPYTGEQSRQKVIDLVRNLCRYQPKTDLIIAHFTEIQKAIKDQCREKYRTLLYRRMMNRVAEHFQKQYKIKAFVTGEALGQVASQTIENLICTEETATVPVLRPLIGMDKSEIIERAKILGTYPISIQPYPDCCTLFQPKKPETRANTDWVRQEEEKLEIKALVDEAIDKSEIIHFTNEVFDFHWE